METHAPVNCSNDLPIGLNIHELVYGADMLFLSRDNIWATAEREDYQNCSAEPGKHLLKSN